MIVVRSGFTPWADKHRRAHRKIKLGLLWRKHERLRFMSLGTPVMCAVSIVTGFVLLRKRIRRLTVRRLVDDGFMSKQQAAYFYGREKSGRWDDEFVFHSVNIRTGEGPNGVYHVLFFGQYIPQNWVYDQWKDILDVDYLANQSVDLQMCGSDVYDAAKLASYCVNQYVANQDSLINSSMSWSWCGDGSVGSFRSGFGCHVRQNMVVYDEWVRSFVDSDGFNCKLDVVENWDKASKVRYERVFKEARACEESLYDVDTRGFCRESVLEEYC